MRPHVDRLALRGASGAGVAGVRAGLRRLGALATVLSRGTAAKLGYGSLEDYLIRDWEASFLKRDPHNLLSMLDTWYRSDVSDNDRHRGDLAAALGSIRAHDTHHSCDHDLYFTVDDCRAEAALIPGAGIACAVVVVGAPRGNPSRSPADQEFLKKAVAELLAAPVQ